MMSQRILSFTLLAAGTLAGNNGMAMSPPMAWRSWNQFQCSVNQALIQAMADGLTNMSRTVNGVPMSLQQLGYSGVGLDDCWQACGSYGPENYTFHNASGFPQVDSTLFDMPSMTSYIHSKGLRAGWYGNNCHCKDHCSDISCFQGDVDAFALFGFDDVKYDGCSTEHNMTLFAALINATGVRAVLENCGNDAKPTLEWCPYHLYRISTDIRPTYGSTMNNAQSIKPYQAAGTTRQGCWAYPDMLEVGVTNNGGTNVPVLSFIEARSHFGLWCVLSSPLTLSLDLDDSKTVDAVWPIISNWEAIAVNQAWAGSAGGVLFESNATTVLQHCAWGWAGDPNCTLPIIQQWYKPLPGGGAAVIVLNHGPSTTSASVDLTSIPGLACASAPGGCAVHDVWAHADAGKFTGSYPVSNLGSHDSAFITLATA